MNTFKMVSDLICPWCYIGKRRLEAALRELPPEMEIAVSWHPFQLNPEMPPQGIDRNLYRARKFGDWERCRAMDAQLTEVGHAVGIEFRFDLQPNVPNTFDAHRVIWLAGRLGVQDAVVEALFRAYFCEGADFSSRATLVEVATSAGLDAGRLEWLLSSDDGAEEVLSEEAEVKGLGISAVPLFIMQDCVAVSGAQPPRTLLEAFRQTQALHRQPAHSSRRHAAPRRRPESCKV